MKRTIYVTKTGRLTVLAGMLPLFLLVNTCKKFEAEQLVIIETGEVGEITYRSCSVTGKVYDAGSEGIDQHGFVWSTQQDPLIEGSPKSELGPKDHTGSFTGTVSGLVPDMTYYIRAYGTAGPVTTYGKEVTFTTASPEVPEVTTAQVSSITDTSALSGGEVTGDGGAGVTARGVCWDTVHGPTLEDHITLDGTGTGTFTSQVGNLTYGTTYYVRAYATNQVGTGYGEELEFTTGQRQPVLPVVSTGDVSIITDTTALCGGEVLDDGGSEVTAMGLCWSTSQEPTVLDNVTVDGSGTGEFSSSLANLTCHTTYYVRAYATNGVGTAYGEQKEFTTPACPLFPPVVTTAAATGITDSSAVSGGQVLDDGGALVTARGVCWGTDPEPTTEDFHTEDGNGTGPFISNLTGLEPLTTYYYRAYATNSEGTDYGEEMELTTLARKGFLQDIDGNEYVIVDIGSQTWMAENLKVTRYADGTPIQLVEDQATWGDLSITDKAYCYYQYDTANMEIYGALYTWPAAMNGGASSDLNPSGIQGVCPAGWHLPSDSEWKEMEMYLGMSQVKADSTRWRGEGIGAKLKATGTDFWEEPNLADNESGFGALPGGHNNSAGYCSNKTIDCYFWSSTDGGESELWYRHLWYERTEVYRGKTYWYGEGYSVRCIKDE